SVRLRKARKRPTMPLVPGRSGATMLRQGCEWDVAVPADEWLASAWAAATDATSPWNVASRSARHAQRSRPPRAHAFDPGTSERRRRAEIELPVRRPPALDALCDGRA